LVIDCVETPIFENVDFIDLVVVLLAELHRLQKGVIDTQDRSKYTDNLIHDRSEQHLFSILLVYTFYYQQY